MSLTLELPQEFYEELHQQIKDVYLAAVEEARADAEISSQWLTVPEARKRLDGIVHNSFKANYEDAGLPVYKIGSKRYVDKDELNDFIRQHRIN